MLLEILIPTFNRAACLRKNLGELVTTVRAGGLSDRVSVAVSDNASTDETRAVLADAAREWGAGIRVARQETNVGLEANSLALLRDSRAEFVMYLGDDDYLPSGYLERVLEILSREQDVACVIAGFSALHADGRVEPARSAEFQERAYPPGFEGVLQVSQFGHQLSGLVLRRAGTLDAYEARPDLRNIYPFIFFVGFCCLHGRAWYLPRFQVLVSQGNSKDWKYDDSGLISEIAKNYVALFPSSPLRAWIAIDRFVRLQSWRLRVPGYRRSLPHLARCTSVPLPNRILTPLRVMAQAAVGWVLTAVRGGRRP